MLWLSCTLLRWYIEPGCLGNGSRSVRPLWVMSMNPSSMSMFGVPYSPMVPSLTRWQSGAWSRSAKSRLSVPTTLLTCVSTACARLIIEYGAERCSAKCTTASGAVSRTSVGHRVGVAEVELHASSIMATAQLLPALDAPLHRGDRHQAVGAAAAIPAPAHEVVDGDDVVALGRTGAARWASRGSRRRRGRGFARSGDSRGGGGGDGRRAGGEELRGACQSVHQRGLCPPA